MQGPGEPPTFHLRFIMELTYNLPTMKFVVQVVPATIRYLSFNLISMGS
jgi:hypothetical protein